MMFALWARDLISVVRIRESQCNRSFFLTGGVRLHHIADGNDFSYKYKCCCKGK